MQIVRTILWVLLLVGLLAFSLANWTAVEVKIWENLVVETKIPALVIVSFLLGLVPMWLIHRGSKWRLQRRISNLETAQTQRGPGSSPASNAHPFAGAARKRTCQPVRSGNAAAR